MKIKSLFYLFASVCLVLSSCSSDDENSGNNSLPEGALPSAEFTTNNLPDEPYAEDAVKIVTEENNAPFYSLELMADGHYLLCTTRPSDSNINKISVKKESNGSFNIHKRGKAKAMRTRSVTDESGTTILDNGMIYGTFTKLGEKIYRLNDGCEVDLSELTGADNKVAYKNSDGTVSNVYVSASNPVSDDAARSLCRTWNLNSLEVWGYFNSAYIAHGKQTLLSNGKVERYFKAAKNKLLDIEEDDFLDPDDELCYKVVFSQNGTYLCFYLDGTSDVYNWEWTDKSQGTIRTWDDVHYWWEEKDELFSTVRFAGKQMRIYTDATDNEDGYTSRFVEVLTLTVAQ